MFIVVAQAVIPDLDRRIALARHDLPHVEAAGSAFIEFNLQIGAHVMDQARPVSQTWVMLLTYTTVRELS